ncbi:hypothetical protein BDV95DRAFT_569696 [Massariosphaeria phaeospora]|uniref:Pentacotripeptide-repeat region of PRORP domain-containing protein n=1 Tax=Massariosphaeria phaeospora TaxID=100035 RepID=A0A7C8M728_9PLEO|nr:hypothetical protein BDV95DRAFT_569696 [Massariosphaeria phaeospora]
MPRACIPNARFLASADTTLTLPYLAPRVFAEPPFPRHHLRLNVVKSTQKQEKGSGTGIIQPSRALGSSRHNGYRPKRKNDGGVQFTPELQSSRRGRLTGPSLAMGRNVLQTPTQSGPVGLRYAEIFSFARKQLRSYSTKPQPTRKVRRVRTTRVREEKVIRTKRVRTIRVREVKTTVPATRVGTRPSIITTINQPNVERDLAKPPARLELRRQRGLQIANKRFQTFVYFESEKGPRIWMNQGRYRSLVRRLYNLRRQEKTVLDMTTWAGESGKQRVLIQGFAALERRVYRSLRSQTYEVKVQCGELPCQEWARALFEETQSYEEVQGRWKTLSEDFRAEHWHILLFYLLDKSPSHALQFIRILGDGSLVKSSLDKMILADALGYLAKFYTLSGSDEPGRFLFIPTFHYISSQILNKYPSACSQDLLLDITRLANIEELKSVFDLLESGIRYFSFDTLLHYANTFGCSGEHEYALRCLSGITQRASSSTAQDIIVERRRFQWSCAVILRNVVETTETVAGLLKIGVKLNILLYNIIMRKAMQAGDYSTAFRVYNLLGENQMEPDKYTYSILLHGCTTAGDPAMFEDFAEHCAVMAQKLEDPYLAAGYLHYLYVRHYPSHNDVSELTAILCHAYTRLFSTKTLESFVLSGSLMYRHLVAESRRDPESVPFEPPPLAVYIMLLVEIKLALETSNIRVWKTYESFKLAVKVGGYPVLNKVASSPMAWNAFLLAFCKKQQFADASSLMKDMTDNSPQPNVYSWNLFMKAFFVSDQSKAAERVYELMRSRGIQPNQLTFEVLLRGYAKTQHIENVAEVMEHIDEEQQLKPRVLKSLAKIHQRKRLMIYMESTRRRKEKAKHEQEAVKRAEREKTWSWPLSTGSSPPPLTTPSASDESSRLTPLASSVKPLAFRSVFEKKPPTNIHANTQGTDASIARQSTLSAKHENTEKSHPGAAQGLSNASQPRTPLYLLTRKREALIQASSMHNINRLRGQDKIRFEKRMEHKKLTGR